MRKIRISVGKKKPNWDASHDSLAVTIAVGIAVAGFGLLCLVTIIKVLGGS